MHQLTSENIIYKKPGELLNLGMDFSKWLQENETISSPIINANPEDLTFGSLDITGGIVVFTCSGGVIGRNYNVEVQVNTSDGEILKGAGLLRVRNR